MSRTSCIQIVARRALCAAVAVGLLLLMSACRVAEDPATRTATGRPSTPSTESPKPEPAVVATIAVGNGAQLERDVIPQLQTAFSASESAVKDTLAAADSILIGDATTGFRRMEGMVPPGSYEVRQDTTLEDLVQEWIARSEQRYDVVAAEVTDPNDLSASERLVLASIVEAECLMGEHQREVAAAFLNRLGNHQRLQSCVTAEYAVGFQRPFLLNKDVAKASPYNTYSVSGLPKGPISAVSDASLAAASSRSADADVYYFFYDYLEGEIYFFSDYVKFRKAAAESRARFDRDSSVGAHDKVDKQKLYGSAD